MQAGVRPNPSVERISIAPKICGRLADSVVKLIARGAREHHIAPTAFAEQGERSAPCFEPEILTFTANNRSHLRAPLVR
jgi:hypothetical protein